MLKVWLKSVLYLLKCRIFPSGMFFYWRTVYVSCGRVRLCGSRGHVVSVDFIISANCIRSSSSSSLAVMRLNLPVLNRQTARAIKSDIDTDVVHGSG